MRADGLLFLLGLVSLAGLVACQPDFGEPASLVQSPRILAVRSEPAEVTPGAAVTLELLFATATGAVTATAVDWAFCLVPKPPVASNVVSDACLDAAGRALGGHATAVDATVPSEACALFGPQLPPTPAGQPPARPRDPDGTGGYYQPVRVRPVTWPGQSPTPSDGPAGFGLTRIQCGLAGASASTAAAYRDRYLANRNPQLITARFTDGDQELSASALPADHPIQLHVAWSPDAAEHFPVFSLASQLLIDQTESLQVAWFANAGHFALAHTVPDPGATASVNEWTTPLTAGPVTVWIVLRDSRGGVDWQVLSGTVR